MIKIVQFKVSKGEDGYYVASATDFAMVTQAKTLELLLENIKEATEVHFDDNNNQYPVMVNFDLADVIYA